MIKKINIIRKIFTKTLTFSPIQKKTLKSNKKGFSVAEAFIALAIGGIVLGMSAPLISKQLQHNNMNDVQYQLLLKKIEEATNVPQNAVMFFASTTCPTGWAKINDFGGHYLRIQDKGEIIGSRIEQMVHKHKHVSPLIRPDWANNHRYGPYATTEDSRITGDNTYPAMPASVNANIYLPYPHTAHFYAWFLYTSDGMNRYENHISYNGMREVLTCPNRDEGNHICKNDGTNLYEVPYLTDMPLVGNQNRPNSISLTACVKGYTSCSMVDNTLNCT